MENVKLLQLDCHDANNGHTACIDEAYCHNVIIGAIGCSGNKICCGYGNVCEGADGYNGNCILVADGV